jgi:hypothetical protein
MGKSIHERMATIKVELSKLKFEKSGHNKHLNFKYHELQDFLQHVTKLNKEHGVNEAISMTNDLATITLTSTEEPHDSYQVTVPFVMADMQPKNDVIQKLGATLTYIRRYLYVQAYAITEGDAVDAQDLNAIEKEKDTVYTNNKKDVENIIKGYNLGKDMTNKFMEYLAKKFGATTWNDATITDYGKALSIVSQLKDKYDERMKEEEGGLPV